MASNIYKSAAQVTLFSTVEKTLSFIYRIILSRIIGAEGIGIYQICLSVFAVFLTAASSGIPITVSRLIAKQSATGTNAGKHAVVSAGVLCTLIITVPAAVIIFFGRNLIGFLFPDEQCLNIFLLLLPGLILTSVYAVMRGAFWGNKQFLPYSVIELAEDAVMVIVGCVLIGFATTATEGAYFATVAVLVSYVFSFTVSICWYLFTGGRFVNPKKQLKPLLASSTPITVMRTSTSLLNSVVAMFLPALLMAQCGYSNSEALAMYGAVTGMSLPMLCTPNSIIGSIAVVVAPEMSENYYANKHEQLKTDIEKTIKSSVFVAMLLVPIFFTLGEDIGVLFYSNEFSGEVIQRFAFMMFPMSITAMSTTVLNSMHCEVKTLIYFFIGALVMLLCIFTLTPLLGINSYMVGLSFSYIITAALNLRLLRKNCNGINYYTYFLKSGAIALGVSICGWLTRRLIVPYVSAIGRLFICGGVIAVFLLGLLILCDMLSIKPIKRLFAKR